MKILVPGKKMGTGYAKKTNYAATYFPFAPCAGYFTQLSPVVAQMQLLKMK